MFMDFMYDNMQLVYSIYPMDYEPGWEIWCHGGPEDNEALENRLDSLTTAILVALYDYEAGGIKIRIPSPFGA